MTSLAFSGNGSRLAYGAADGRVGVWDLATGRPLAHRLGTGRVTSVALDRTGSIFAAAAAKGRTSIWATASGRLLHTFRIQRPLFPPVRVAILGDHTIVVGDTKRRLMWWDVRSNALLRTLPGIGGLIGPPSVSTYSPDMRRFAGVWLGRPDVRTPDVFDLTRPRRDHLLEGPAMALDAMAFNRNGQMLATAGEGRVVLWSVRQGRVLDDALSGVPGATSAVTFSPDGRFIAAAAERGVTIWDLRKLALLRSLKARGAILGHVAPAQQGTASAAFSPNGRLLAWSLSGPPWAGIVVWRLADTKEVLRFPAARVVGFSPDGKQLAGSVDSFESDLVVVDLGTGKRRRVKKLPWAASNAAVAAPTLDHPWVVDGGKGVGASGALGGTVTLWDTRRRQPIATLRAPGVIERPFLVFDRAGQKLALATAGGAMTLVDLAVESWRVSACRLAGRTLTATEWRLFVGTKRSDSAACSG